jgi:hypothetical protein
MEQKNILETIKMISPPLKLRYNENSFQFFLNTRKKT